MANKEYDKIADQYENATIRPMRNYCYNYTVETYIPDLTGKRVLDLGCGEGVSSRRLIDKGAKEVVGIDNSDELIKKAKEKDTKNISYYVSDIFNDDWSSFGKFDVITGIMVIHYADSAEKINKLFLKIKNALNETGVFYAMTINPSIFLSGYHNYGVNISRAVKEGDSVKIELFDFDWNKFCEFTNYYWSEKTYLKIFTSLGFDAEFKPGLVSPEATKEFGGQFWADYLNKPIYNFIIAQKI